MPLSQVMSHSIDSIYFSYKYSVFRYITKKKKRNQTNIIHKYKPE